MSILREDLKIQKNIPHKLLCALSGSRLLETNEEASNFNYIGIFAHTWKDLYDGDKRFTINDTIYYELSEFIELLKSGNILAHRLLWTPFNKCIFVSNYVDELKDNCKKLISRKILRIWIDEADRLYQKSLKISEIRGESKGIFDFLKFSPATTITRPLVRNLSEVFSSGKLDPHSVSRGLPINTFGLEQSLLGQNIYWLFEYCRVVMDVEPEDIIKGFISKEDTIIKHKFDNNAMRSLNYRGIVVFEEQAFKKYKALKEAVNEVQDYMGYGNKSMYHSFDYLLTVITFLNKGEIEIPSTKITLLRDIKRGKLALDQVVEKFEEYKLIAEQLLEKCTYHQEEMDQYLLKDIIYKIREQVSKRPA